MKKIFIVLFALVLTLSFGSAFAGPGSPGDILGQGKLDSQAHKIFRFVRYCPTGSNANETFLSKDSIVVWSLASADGVTITTTTTSRDSAVAGIAVMSFMTNEAVGNTATQDIGRRNWGYIQTYGLCNAMVPSGGSLLLAAAGNAIGTSKHPGLVAAFSVDSKQLASYDGDDLGNCGFNYGIPAAAHFSTLGVFLKGID